MSERLEAIELLETLTNDDNGYTHKEILEFIIKNFLSGDKALACMKGAVDEFPLFEDEDSIFDEEKEDEMECPNCMSIDFVIGNITEEGNFIYKCNDCEEEFIKN
jgi:DNA-directed RNA polymerase subunit RPC12/RpoP